MLPTRSLSGPLNKKRPINHLAAPVGLGYWCWSELSHYPSWVDLTLKAPKKKSLPTPLTLKNQHGENYILVEELNKCWPSVAVEVEKGPAWRLQSQWCGSRAGGKGEATWEEVCVSVELMRCERRQRGHAGLKGRKNSEQEKRITATRVEMFAPFREDKSPKSILRLLR